MQPTPTPTPTSTLTPTTTSTSVASPTPNLGRYFIYARKSTDDKSRQVRSIQDQINEARALADRERLRVIDVLIEKKSAKAPGRPVFNGMMERINRGEATGVIAWHPDRLARNALDAGLIIHMIDLGKLSDLRFPTFRFEATAQGKFTLNILLSQSKYYVDSLSENIKRGKRHAVAAGLWPQAAPMGYVNDRGLRTIAPHPVQGPLVKEMFELYATGKYTLAHVHQIMHDKGMRSSRGGACTLSKVQLALRNPIYYGVLRFHGEFYDGRHKPLITKALFDQCQSIMQSRRHKKSRGFKPFLYRGAFRCGECGACITMERQKGKTYLRCTKKLGPCTQPYVREEEVRQQVRRTVSHFAIRPAFAEELRQDQEAFKREHRAQHEQHIRALEARLQALQQSRARLTEAYADQLLSVEEFRHAKNKYVLEARDVEEKLHLALRGVDDRLEPLRRVVNTAELATYALDRGNDAEIFQIYESLGSNRTLRDRRLACVLHEAWQLFVDEQDTELGGSGSGIDLARESQQEREKRIKRRGDADTGRALPSGNASEAELSVAREADLL